MKEEEKIDFHIRIDREIAERIDKMSEALGQDRSEFLERGMSGCSMKKEKEFTEIICPGFKTRIEKIKEVE